MSRREDIMARVREPTSAAVAGIVFAVILGAVVLLLRSAAPDTVAASPHWTDLEAQRESVSRALGLIPFAGIAFLWFIGVIRSQLGSLQDRFIETVFLGSGLVFVALLFTAAAVLAAALTLNGSSAATPETRALAWAFASSLLGEFGARMAAVFTLSVTTVGRRTGTLPGWLSGSGYLVGLLLLVTPPLPFGAQLLFPAWILVLSVHILTGRHRRRAMASGAAAAG